MVFNIHIRMKNLHIKLSFLFISLCVANSAMAQGGLMEGSQWLTLVLLGAAAFIAFFFIVQVADNFLAIEAKSSGIDTEKNNFSVFPRMGELFGPSVPDYTEGSKVKVLRQGHDIILAGAASGSVKDANVRTFAVQPKNFIGMSPIPKVVVEVGDNVKAGEVLFYDKKKPDIKYVSPVSGEVAEIKRAEKRSIAEIIIIADQKNEYVKLSEFNLLHGTREELVDYLLATGGWSLIRQRPYDIVADPTITPRDIFISTFDTAPLAPDSNVVVAGRGAAFQRGIDVLNRLTSGKVYLGLNGGAKDAPSSIFTNATNAEKVYFKGKHPAGNVGVQIHHTAAINAGDTVWTLGVQEVITLGAIFTEERFNAERVVAIAGAELHEPRYVRTYAGANMGELVKDNLSNDHIRLVSGDVLSGKTKESNQFLNYYDDQVTVLAEGDEYEMFGWLLPLKARPSVSRTFPNFLFPDQEFEVDTNTHGEKRAFVMSSDYERVMPMDVHVQPLMKSILVNDLERMEGLGLYELSEEDVALCEFVCTSKMPLQKILREGLNTMREQG